MSGCKSCSCSKNSKTLVFLKPDVFEKNVVGNVIAEFEKAGVTIGAMKLLRLSQKQAEKFYEVHREQKFYQDLVKYVTRGPVLAMVLHVDDAVPTVRKIIGATDPTKAEKTTIRGKFGESLDANVIHGSDSPENAEKEIAFFFNRLELV